MNNGQCWARRAAGIGSSSPPPRNATLSLSDSTSPSQKCNALSLGLDISLPEMQSVALSLGLDISHTLHDLRSVRTVPPDADRYELPPDRWTWSASGGTVFTDRRSCTGT